MTNVPSSQPPLLAVASERAASAAARRLPGGLRALLERAACGVLVMAFPSEAAAQQAIADTTANWAHYARGLAGEKLRADVAGFARGSQRRRLVRTRVQIYQRRDGADRTCSYPTDLASAEEDPQRAGSYLILLCADNLRTMNFMARQWFAAQMMPYETLAQSTVLNDYLVMVAGELHRQRTAEPESRRYPCSLRHYIYLARQVGSTSGCTNSSDEQDGQYRAWLTENQSLVNWGPLRELQVRTGATHLADQAFLEVEEARYLIESFGSFLVFAVVHEYGHVALGHLDRDRERRCASYRDERAADDFAVNFLLRQGLERRSDLSMGQMPWTFLVYYTRGYSGADHASDALVAARLETIFTGLRADSRSMAAELPQGAVTGRLTDFANHRDLELAIAQLRATRPCATGS